MVYKGGSNAMKIEFQKKSYTLIIKIQGEIDHHCATELKQKIEKEYQKSDAKNIIFDFEQVTFMDSSGIGMLIGRYKYALAYGGKTAVANANERVLKIFQMAGMQKIIPQYTSITEALKAMGGVENAV